MKDFVIEIDVVVNGFTKEMVIVRGELRKRANIWFLVRPFSDQLDDVLSHIDSDHLKYLPQVFGFRIRLFKRIFQFL